jgi:ATP-dependent RNA helicase SrmB
MLFSATLECRGVEGFTADLLKNPAELDAEPSRRERKKITQWYHRADSMEHKYQLLKHVVTEQADLRSKLESDQITCAWIQGEFNCVTDC